MELRVFLTLALVYWGCSSNPVSQVSEDLSRVLSITNLSKFPIPDRQNADLVIGVSIQVDVVNTADVPIQVPFTITWVLRGGDGAVLGQASQQLAGLAARGRERVAFTISFEARPDLSSIRDEVTFDAVQDVVVP